LDQWLAVFTATDGSLVTVDLALQLCTANVLCAYWGFAQITNAPAVWGK
jgi:hypothetical protein